MATMVWRAFSPIPLRSRSTSSRQRARASEYCLDGGEGLGQGELEVQVVRAGGECGPRGLDAAGTLGLEAERQLGLEPLGLGLEEAATFQRGDRRRGVLDPSLGQGDAGQADLGLGQVGLERQRLAVPGLGGTGIRVLEPACPARRATRPRSAGAGRSSSARPTRAGPRRRRRSPGRPARRRPPGSIGRRTGRPRRDCGRCRPWPARTCRHTRAPASRGPG